MPLADRKYAVRFKNGPVRQYWGPIIAGGPVTPAERDPGSLARVMAALVLEGTPFDFDCFEEVVVVPWERRQDILIEGDKPGWAP